MSQGNPAQRVPPHSQEAEVAVLGAILLEPTAMNAVADILHPESFYRADHQKVYQAFTALYNRNAPIDLVSVREELRRMGADDVASNNDLFLTLGGAVPSFANAEYYAKIVRGKHLLRSLIQACTESIVAAYDENTDASEILDRAEDRVFQVATQYEDTHIVEVKNFIHSVVDAMIEHPQGMAGLPTGYPDLDHMTGGLHRGEFIVIGGRPSTGKTTLALNLIRHIAVHSGQGVLLFSLEMPREQIVQNLLCSTAGISATPVRMGQLDRSQWQKVKEAASLLYDAPFFVDDSASLTPSQLRAKCRRLLARCKGERAIKLIIIDYLQLMSAERQSREPSRQEEISHISRGIKSLAKELGVPVIALSQLSRAAVGEASSRPKLSHLRESGAIEQDADLVILLYQDESPDAEEPNVTELIIAKQRNGPTGTVKVTFLKDQLRFESYSRYSAVQVGSPEEEPEPF